MELLTPSGGTIFYTVVTFVILMFILKKVAWKPILHTLEEREKRIQDSLDQAEKAKEETEKLLSEQKELLEAARQESQEIIAQGRKVAEMAKEEIIYQARSEANRLLTNAKREIDWSREKALEEIRDLAVELSLSATSKIIGKSLDKREHMAFVDESINQLGGLK
jgi:F-type H+-transporting ATPase subunit b